VSRASSPVLVLRDADVGGRRCDVRIAGGLIASIDPSMDASTRTSVAGADLVVECEGGALLPGLHDHHVHLLATAAAACSVQVGPPDVRDHREFAAALTRAATLVPEGGWIRAVGYHDSVAGPLNRWRLDAVCPDRAVRVQHRSGALWILNSAALRAAGIDTVTSLPDGAERDEDQTPTGRFFRLDTWLRQRVPPPSLEMATLGGRLASFGVTGVTDATPYEDASELIVLSDAIADGRLPVRVSVTGAPGIAGPLPEGLHLGPAKLLLPDHNLPSLDDLVDAMRAARDRNRNVAVHCVTREALVLTLTALREAGSRSGDRIEHGAVIPRELFLDLAELGLCVVTQPGFVAVRGDDYLAEVDPVDVPDLWRCGSLLDAGIPVAAGTDAPFGHLDPWYAVATAIDRRTATGVPFGPGENLAPRHALRLFLGTPQDPGGSSRQVTPGASADLCLLDRPLRDAVITPRAHHVRATIVGGVVVYQV
jgi:predicted amidohydrolase YtcJ